MQNYRNNAMPYNTYRQMQSPSRRDDSRMDDSRMDNTCSKHSYVDGRNTFKNMSLAMAYVPWQTWRDIYDAEKGFHRGTIFEELDLPFLGKGGMKR